uniref:protein Shroom2 n=1 Tax=Euleptes europaea TaxID=460621 RepID=UPI00253FA544|nr:protein Shroom2 [Euleptes europaea]
MEHILICCPYYEEIHGKFIRPWTNRLSDILESERARKLLSDENPRISADTAKFCAAASKIRRKLVRTRQGNDACAPGPDDFDEISLRDKFRIRSFIAILDALEANLRSTTVYSDVAQMFSFLANLTASQQEIQQGVELLMEAYPEDVDLKFTLTQQLLERQQDGYTYSALRTLAEVGITWTYPILQVNLSITPIQNCRGKSLASSKGECFPVTEIEEGSRAAAVDKLLAGDEIVSINDVGLSGFRQEAICLVKGSHKMLKLVVKRKNDLACRPHSWHATKFTENQPETATSRLPSTNVCASWHSRYHASSSSHDLSSSWDQSNLHRTSDQFSSAGSMDSWDQTPQTYQYGQISSAKSNSSIDHLGNPSKRDSAYGSFSTSSSTPDHTLSNVDVASAENVLYKTSHWDTTKQGNGKTASFLSDNGGLEEKSACFPPPPQYENNSKSPRLEDHSDAKYSGSGRSNFGPVWYVPEKKKSPSPPPPPPPLRSDSFAATKGHERTHAPLYSEGVQSTQHFEVLHRPQARNDWSTEAAEQQKRAARVIEKTSDGKHSCNPVYRSDLSLDYSLPCAGDRVNNNIGNANRLHSSLSSTDIRFAQSVYGHHCHHHQRQYSDESTFFHNSKNSALPKEQLYLSSCAGLQERPADKHNLQSNPFRTFGTAASDISSEEKMDSTGLSRHYCVAMKQPAQGNSRPLQLKDGCWNSGIGAQASTRPHENPAVAMMTQSPKYYLPQQPLEPPLDACEKSSRSLGDKGDDVRTAMVEDSKRFSYPEKSGQTKNFENHNSYNEQEYAQECALMPDDKTAPKDFKWGQEEKHKISPQKTPMLHSLAQEGKNQPDKGAETGFNRQPMFDAHLSKNARRSDRFATTLRNEIQMRRAKLQKSKSSATLAESTETEEFTENWKTDSAEKVNPSSENYFTNEYKDNLKEAQARVLRATSFQRKDLEPSSTDYFPDRKANNYNSTLLALVSEDESGIHEATQSSKQSSPASNHHISRIGGRKRFTGEQKLKSYSEPEKMNEVGVSDDDYHPQRRPTTSEEALGTFADRWKFFEETSKPAYQKSSQTNIVYGQPEGQPSSRRRNSHEAEGSWYVRRMRAASFGIENMLGAYNRSKDSVINTGHKTKSGQPQRLETFAEYQASWKEQRKPLETRSSGRYHSADNILDAGHEQLEKPQYTHERSRSSPSTDFHKQKVSTEARRQTENSREAEEHKSSPTKPDERNCSSRPVDAGYPEGPSGGTASQPDYGVGIKWKASIRPPHTGQTSVLPQGSRSRSGTLPSDYRYSQENVNEKNKDYSVLPPLVSELQVTDEKHLCQSQVKGEESQQAELGHLNKKHGPVSQRPPPPKRDNKHRWQDNSSASVAASSESLLTTTSWPVQSVSPVSSSVSASHFSPSHTAKVSGKLASTELPEVPQLVSIENVCQHLDEKTHLKSEPVLLSSTYRYLQKPGMETSRSPSPQFAPQKLTDKPPVAVQDENPTRIERVMDNNTMVKMVPIKIVHSESHAEKESRQNLTSAIEPPALPSGLEKDQIKTLSTSEQSYSRFCAYTRQGVESEPEKKTRLPYLQPAEALGTNLKDSDIPAHTVSYVRAKEKTIDDWKSEELAREIVGKDKSLADILDPNVKIRTTMDLMVGIFPKDEHLLEEAQQRRKLLLKVPSPKATDDKKEEQPLPLAIPLTTNSTYYSTSAPKAELLIKMKDMQQQQQQQQQSEEDSEDELDHDLSEKKQELIDSISRKLQVLREARETLLEDIQANNLLGDEVEAIVKEVCKSNEFDKFRMFIGDLDKVVNLLLSLSGRLARVENALNNLDENASPEERRVLVEKQKLLTRQHEDAKELKENLDRRERIVFDILASYLSDENLADYEHFVKMKSALIIEQRELEDKIKLGEEQLKCLTESLQPERPK